MKLKTVLYEENNGIAIITLNRPHRMNAWTGRMNAEYRYSLQQAEDNQAIRTIIITGSGKGFCVGGDSKVLQGHVEKGGYDPGTPEQMMEPGYGIRDEFNAPFAYQSNRHV